MTAAPAEWIESLAGLPPGDAGHAEFFSARANLRNPGTVELIHQEVLRVVYADLSRAERLARAACRLADDLGDPDARATGLRAMGHVSYAGSRYEDAVGFYRQALEILQPLGRDHVAGRTLLSGLQSLIYLGRYDEAYAWANRAGEIFQGSGDELRLARLASNVGNILYRQDRYLEALSKYDEAYSTLSRVGEPSDVAAVLSNVAVCQISLSRFSEALNSYRKARDYCETHGLPLLVAGADYNIAYLHYLQGDFLRASELYKASRQHCRDAGDRYHAALCDLDEAEIYLELNLNAEAASLAGQAEAGFQSLGMPYERGKAMVTHAIATSRRGQPRLARLLLSRARAPFAGEQNALWPALIDLYRAMLLERENCDREAARLCRGTYRVLSESVFPSRIALAELLQSRLLLKAGQIESAREMAARAHARLEGAGTPWLRFHVHFAQGQVEEQAGDQTAAVRAFRAARAAIEIMRSRLWGDEPKISFLKDKLAVYESLVQAALSLRADAGVTTQEAFLCIQQAKSRSLADLISQTGSAPIANQTLSGRETEIEETRRHLNTQYRHMERLTLSAQSATAAQFQTLKQSVRDSESRLLHLLSDSESGGRLGVATETLTVAAIQSAIPADAVLLEYYVVKGVLCVCIVNTSRLEIVPLGAAAEIASRLRLLRFQMRKSRRRASPTATSAVEAATESHLRDLYDDLIAPVRNRIGEAGHLIFAPHDFLHHLPFHALRGPYGYVIDEFTVSYAPSATVFALCNARHPRFGAQSLVLGLPDQLAPRIALEAETAAGIVPGARLFLGEDATEQVLRDLGPDSRLIHIATHGLFRRDNPLFSAIRLGDSHLTLLDLYHLPLSAELVTLSGCSTGLNVVVGGDELLGLIRGVLLAGAHAVMVSLWDINDTSTAEFMRIFYGHLRATRNKAAALRDAMLRIREEYPHPYYWAPFVLAGKYALGELEEASKRI